MGRPLSFCAWSQALPTYPPLEPPTAARQVLLRTSLDGLGGRAQGGVERCARRGKSPKVPKISQRFDRSRGFSRQTWQRQGNKKGPERAFLVERTTGIEPATLGL